MTLRSCRPNRRGFLTVVRPDRIRAHAGRLLPASAGPRRAEELRLHRSQSQKRDPHLPAGRDCPSGDVRSQAVRADRVSRRDGLDSDQDSRRSLLRNTAADRSNRRQAHRVPRHVARRSRPRARHAQHVHRLSPQPRAVFPSMGSVVSHEYGPRNNLPPYVCIPNLPNEYSSPIRRNRRLFLILVHSSLRAHSPMAPCKSMPLRWQPSLW